jgi:hypothetical protein
MTELARRFDEAFPRAQFIVTLGNEDSACGDYGVAPDGAFLRAVAKAWEPLVNRRGAAPRFAQTFARDGFYTARLPVPGLRAVVVDDVFWSPLFHRCGGTAIGSAQTLAELAEALRRGRADRSWIVLHIPPGVDVFSTTHVVHRFAVVPFLDPRPRARLGELVGDPANRVELVVAGHAHRFSYRVLPSTRGEGVPLLMVPAVSPVYRTRPAFLRVEVDDRGAVGEMTEYGWFDEGWRALGGTRELGVPEFTAPALRGLTKRLERDDTLRERFAALYNAGAIEITRGNLRSYLCATTEFAATPYRRCVGSGGYSVLTGRGLLALGIAALALAAGALFFLRRRRRRYGA